MKRYTTAGVVAAVILFWVLARAQTANTQCTKETEAQTLSVSGNTLTFQDGCGTQTNTFELVIAGGPATFTATLNGVMRGGTVEALATTSTTTATQNLHTSGGPYDRYTFTATWTGGASPSVVVNRTASTARRWGTPAYIDVMNPRVPGSNPCQVVGNAAALGATAEIDIRGIGTLDLPPCDAASANTMFANFTSGVLKMGNHTMWVPLAPSSATTDNAPPGAVIVLANSTNGIEGLARGACTGNKRNSAICVCTGTNTPVQGCVAPSSRWWPVSAVTVGVSGTTPARTYMTVTPCTALNTPTAGCPAPPTSNIAGFVTAGEPVRILGMPNASKMDDGAWSTCTNVSAGHATFQDAGCPGEQKGLTSTMFITGDSHNVACASPCNTSTTSTNALSTSTTPVNVLVASSTGFLQGNMALIEPGANQEYDLITNVPDGTHVTVAQVTLSHSGGVTFNQPAIVSAPIDVVDVGPVPYNNAFGPHLDHLAIDCQAVMSCWEIRSTGGNENTYIRDVKLTNHIEGAIEVRTTQQQNSGWFGDFEILAASTGGPLATVGTTGIYVRDCGVSSWIGNNSINFTTSWTTVMTAVRFETNSQCPVGNMSSFHMEKCQACVNIGQGSPGTAIHLNDVYATPSAPTIPGDGPYCQNSPVGQCTGGSALAPTLIRVDGNFNDGSVATYTSDYSFQNIRKAGLTNVLVDAAHGFTHTDTIKEVYAVDCGAGTAAPCTYIDSAPPVAFAALPVTPPNGTERWCTNCGPTTAATCSTNTPASCVCVALAGSYIRARFENFMNNGANWYCR